MLFIIEGMIIFVYRFGMTMIKLNINMSEEQLDKKFLLVSTPKPRGKAFNPMIKTAVSQEIGIKC